MNEVAKRMIGRDYKDIPQPVIKTFDERTVRLMQIEFEAKGVPYTGMINGNESKMVVSASNLSEIDRIIADINIGDRLKERLGENYKIGIAPDSRRRVTNTVTGEEELFDSFSAANYAYELREVEKANQEETKEQDEELFINESFRSYIDAMQESISQSDWNEAKNACDNINDLIDRALGIDKEDTSVSPVEETINRLSLEELTRAINTQENRILALAENRDFDGMRAAIELRDSLKKNYDERKSAEQSEVLTVDDVQTLRSIEPKRKSVQNMLDTEVAQVPRFEKQQAEKMGSKSAFEMRKEGGNDWRNDESHTVKIVKLQKHIIPENLTDVRRDRSIHRGSFINADTGVNIAFSKRSIDESVAKALQEDKRGMSVEGRITALYNMQDLIENAVCFDTKLSEVGGKRSDNTIFMHQFYAPMQLDDAFYLAKLAVEEAYFTDMQGNIDTNNRVYSVLDMKITPVEANRIFSPTSAVENDNADTSTSVTTISIPQLYELVKTYDKNFFENPLAFGRTEREEEITLHAAAEDAIHTYQNELSNNKDQSRELTRSTNRNGDTVIGNKEFRYIADKKYISGLDHATANILIEKLNEIGLDLSSSFRADGTATVTVSGDENKAKAQDIIDGLNTLEKDFEQLSDASNRLNEISDASDKKGITIDGKDGTWSVINTMTYGGKELSLLENDEQGEDVPYIILDGDNNVLSDKVYSFEDFTSVYTESEVALGLVSGKGITLTVAEFDNGSDIETAVFDDHLSIEDIERTQEYQDYAEKSEFEDITVRAEQYLIGFSELSALTEEQAEYIRANLAAVKNDASLWDSKTATLNKFKDIADRQAERAIDINEALADSVGSPEEKAELQREFDSLTGAEQNFIPTRLFTVEQNDTVQYFTTDKTADELLTIAANSDSRTRHVSISDYIQKQDIPDKTAYTGLGAERIDVSAEYAASMWENGFEVYVDGEAVEPHTPDSSMELFRTDRAFSAQFGDVKKQQMIDFISNEIEELDMTMPEDKYVYVRDFIDEEEDDPFDWGDGQNVYLNITRALIEHKFDFIDDYLTSVKNDYDSIRAERAQDVLFEYKHYSPPSVEYTTVIDIPEYNFYVDLKNIDELYLENDYSYYEGGIDSDGHERKDNYSRQTESLTITLNPLGTAVVERYDSKSEYNIVQTEYDLSDEVDVSELRDKVSNFIESSDELSITSKKEEVSTDIQIHEQRELAALGEEERPEPTAVNQGISTITEGGEDLSALESITSAITDKKKTFVQNIARMSEEDIITFTAERVAESDIPDNEHEFETTVAYEASTPETVTGEKLHKGDIVLNDKALWRVTDDVTMKHGMSLSMERISTGSGAVKQGVMGDPSTRSFVRVGHEKAEISFSARAETEKSVEQISLFGAVPADEVKTADNIRPYDVFRSNDGDKTVISVEDDGIRTLHTEDINGKEYAIEETVSAEELVNDNAFVGNDLIPDVVTDAPERVVENAVDYRITDDDFNAHGNKKERFRQNINAITTLKKIESEGRTATPEEQEILAKYVGWGGIPEAFDNRISAWSNEYAELKEILSSDEYAAARASTLNAHYTSPVVIETMYKALENMGFKGGKILDPSVGTGNFLGAMPEEMYAHSKVTGVELDSITGRIAGQLYQSADIKVQGFEKTVLQNNSFDVAISNVPFGDYKLHDKNYDNLNFHIHDYFFAKSLDKVHPGGIVAFVTSSGTMDKASENVRRYLAERADFLGAVRLPNTAFRNIAGTSVTSDIIFLQKRDAAVAIDPEKESWIGRKEISVADPRYIQPERNNTTDMKVGDRLHIKQRLWDYDRRVYFNVSYTAEIKDILSVSRNRTVSFQLGSIELDDSVDEYDKEQFKKNYLENDTCYIDQYSFCLKKEFNANSSRPDTSVEFLGNALEKEDQFTQLSINQYFADHPEMVVGHIEYDTNPKSSHMMCVADEDSDLRTQLEKAVSNISGEYRESAETKKEHENWLAAPAGSATYSYIIQDDKLYFRDGTEIMKPVNIKADDRDRIMGMVGLVEATKELLSAESSYSNDGDEAITELMQKLNDKYDAFVEKYGKIGDANNVKLFKNDSNSHLIKSLEKWDENLQTKERTYVGKADIMTNRLLYQTAQIDHVDTAADALVVSLSEKLDVDLEFMSHITGMSEEDLITELDGQIYQDPEQSMKWVTAAEYLSDNIYRKIEAAENAGMTHNAEVLRKYIPTPVEAQDIKVKLGSTWIPEQYYKQFLSETLHLSYDERSKFDVHYGETDGSWKIDRVKNKSAYNSYVNEVYGNSDMDAFQIAEAKLNLRIIEVKKPLINPDTGLPVFDNKGQVVKVVDANATKEVNLLAEKMERDFQNWIFKDPQRRDTLVQKYNKTFNCYRPREYDGSFLNFVGKNQNITLKPHQINAVARALMSGNTLLAHEVGAGKTYEMIAIAMEGKRLGQHKKSMICTPNHLTEQFGQSFRELYPGAKILVATTDDFSKNKRKDLIGKIATGDWDAVIIGHSQLGKLAVSSEEQQRFVDKRVSMIDRMINELGSAGAKSFSVKSAENMKQKLYSKLEKAMKREREDWISFEQLGIDKLFVDESQEFKNLGAISKTNVPGIGTTTSDRALNLKSITEYLDHKTGYNGTVFATGTPVSNSLSETYTLMEYLMEDRLDELDIDTFDKWASTFGEITTDSYLKADSSGQYEMKQKFTNIINAAEFHTIFRMMSDIKTADSLDIERPEAKVHTVVARPSMAQKEFIKQLGQRADDIQDKTKKVDPSEDNMLKITSDGRKCGLDMRCIDPYARDNPNSKLNLCVKNLIQTYNDTTDKKGTQLVFCDLATPQPEENPAKAILMKRNSGKYSPTLTCAYNDDKIAAIENRLNKRIENLKGKKQEDKDKIWAKNDSSNMNSLGFYADPKRQDFPDGIETGDIIVLTSPDEKAGISTNTAYEYNNGKYSKLSKEEMSARGIAVETEYHKQERFCAYDDIKKKLIAAGIPEKEIAFIHDAKDEEAKLALYDAMNKGDIRIMIGSSAKCGAGMNAQKHMVAIHHLDAPLRPSDMTQRDGRGVRQGNENSEIDIYRYVTDRTFDSYIYQILETKQKGFSQIMTDKPVNLRTFEDISEAALDYGKTKALCSGNPAPTRYNSVLMRYHRIPQNDTT